MALQWPDFEPPPSPSPGIPVWTALTGVITYGDVSYRLHRTKFVLGFQTGSQVEVMDVEVEQPAQPQLQDRIQYRLLRVRFGYIGWRTRRRRRRRELAGPQSAAERDESL